MSNLSVIRLIFAKATVRGILAIIFGLFTCIGFYKGMIDPKDFVVLVTIIMNYLYSEINRRRGETENGQRQ